MPLCCQIVLPMKTALLYDQKSKLTKYQNFSCWFQKCKRILKITIESYTFLKSAWNFLSIGIKSLDQYEFPVTGGKLSTVFLDRYWISPRRGNWVPSQITVFNFPTSGKGSSKSNELWGKFNTIIIDGLQFPHFQRFWGIWSPSRKTVLYFPIGGEIEDHLKKRYWISQLEGK